MLPVRQQDTSTMASRPGALRDALISTSADPEKAAKAAEELAGYENRLAVH